MTQRGDERPIVVGVDGSASSKVALAWAVRQARLEGAPVHAVIAWDLPSYYGWGVPVTGQVDFADDARTVIEQTVKEVVGGDASVPVSILVVQGNAAHTLIEASRRARLLVVGNRGHGGFSEALLGSTSQHCTHHAVCPVIVVRDPRIHD